MDTAPTERRARRTANASIAPLAVLAFTFFLPAQWSCGSADIPAKMTADSPTILPLFHPYVFAAALMALLIAANLRGPTLALARGMLVVSTLNLVGTVICAVALVLSQGDRFPPPTLVVLLAVAAALVGCAVWWRIFRRAGWSLAASAITLFGVSAPGSWVASVLLTTLLTQHDTPAKNPARAVELDPDRLLYGGVLTLVTIGALALLSAFNLVANRRAPAAGPLPSNPS